MPDPALAAMVTGRDDNEILGLSRMFGGPETITDMFIDGLADVLDGATLPTPVVVGYRVLHGSASYEHTLRVGGGEVEIDEVPMAGADATFRVSFPDLVRLAAGVLDMPTAQSEGRVDVSGSDAVAAQVLQLLAEA